MKKLILILSALIVAVGCSNVSKNNAESNNSDETIEYTEVAEPTTEVKPTSVETTPTTVKTEESKEVENPVIEEDPKETETEEPIEEESSGEKPVEEEIVEEEIVEEPVEELPVSFCGDGEVDTTNEECDGNNLNGENCATMGYDYGSISCSTTCILDTTQCVNNQTPASICGNYQVEEGEECDGSIPIGASDCKYYGYDHGYITCTDCKINTSPCYNDEPEPTCDTDCGPNAGCVNGECTCRVTEYGQRWENCDSDWSNGCETPVNRTYSCGTCGNLNQCNQLEECTRNYAEGGYQCTPFGENDCNEADPLNSGCSTHEIEWCVCSREGHPECCALPHGWTQECADYAMTECVDVQTGRRPCDEATLNPGCHDSVIEDCVVADGGTGCTNYWTAGCVSRAKNACSVVSADYFE